MLSNCWGCSQIVHIEKFSKTNWHLFSIFRWILITAPEAIYCSLTTWKRDFSPLYRNAAFFSMKDNLKTRLPCITKFHLLLCSRLQAVVREPTEDKLTTFMLRFFLGYFLLFQTVKTCFFLMNYSKLVSTAHANAGVSITTRGWRVKMALGVFG